VPAEPHYFRRNFFAIRITPAAPTAISPMDAGSGAGLIGIAADAAAVNTSAAKEQRNKVRAKVKVCFLLAPLQQLRSS
jgi:hypothetical protein